MPHRVAIEAKGTPVLSLDGVLSTKWRLDRDLLEALMKKKQTADYQSELTHYVFFLAVHELRIIIV